MDVQRRICLSVLAALISVVGFPGSVRAQSWGEPAPLSQFPLAAWQQPQTQQVSIEAITARTKSIGGFARESTRCETVIPALHLDDPPQHGSVCYRIEELDKRAAKWSSGPPGLKGCPNQYVIGVRIFYTSRAGHVGHDRLRYRAAVRPIQIRVVNIRIHSPVGDSPLDAASSKFEVPQSRGPIPPCSTPVS